jgi:2-polyprenyl-3-methyl-5-hydroxy-6-metoxy-1,4-benzoquinol methylase
MAAEFPGARATPDELVGRLFDAGVAMMDLLSVYIGDRLGLYRALAENGPANARELASRASIDPRYAREWLEQQATTGIIEVNDAGLDPESRSYGLPVGYADVLTDPDSLSSMAPLARSIVACTAVLPQLLTAFRTGGGVPWSAYGADMIEAQGDFNRPWLTRSLGTEYLPAIPDIHERLRADPPARVADVACGAGWAAIAIARAYPKVSVEGFDIDEASIDLARKNALAAGVDDRVTFHGRDAAEPPSPGRYDLAVIVEAVHDLARPVEVLAAIRTSLKPEGSAIVIDEKTPEAFAPPGDVLERLFYGYSILCCLPTALTERPSAATGTVMRPDTLRGYAREAGFGHLEVLDLPHDTMRFYRLRP